MRKIVNPWIKLSMDYANQRSYLDDLFSVYPTIPEGIRDTDPEMWKGIERAFKQKNNRELLSGLLKLELFPIKDSYVAYLRKDRDALDRNPKTVDRICGQLYNMGLDEIYDKSSEPKETNRQMGPLFKRWLDKKVLGLEPVEMARFMANEDNAVLDASDAEMKQFAQEELGCKPRKGLDLVARFNGKYVIGEAKFLTNFGGNQNNQFDDAISVFKAGGSQTIPIAILDGVLYIETQNKIHKEITTGKYRRENIMSALVLREFLYQL